MVTLILVTGSGRSGTSSVAGTLKRFGFHVPQPEKQADEWNPRGYYEPSFVAGFHARWLKGLGVRDIDTRPGAGAIALADLTAEREERLRTWLVEQVALREPDDVMVVKETRAYWVYPLWERVAVAAGVELVSLTMLRHPTQVVRSRDVKHLADAPPEVRLQRETANVAAWANSVFLTEAATRGNPRAWVPYPDLIGDWRAAMTRACGQLGVDPGDLTPPHAVDEFVTASLNRSADTWEGLSVPAPVRDLADRTWTAVHGLVDAPHDPASLAALDGLRAEYAELYAAAEAVAADATAGQVLDARRQLKQRLELKNDTIRRLRERVARLEGRDS